MIHSYAIIHFRMAGHHSNPIAGPWRWKGSAAISSSYTRTATYCSIGVARKMCIFGHRHGSLRANERKQ
jgi:hypothetical protein